MPRKGPVSRRPVAIDAKYADAPVETRRRVTRLINGLMRRGKKATAERIVYGAFDLVAEKAKDDPLKVFEKAIGQVRPRVEVKSRRVGGANYQVPVDVRAERQLALALRWLIQYARKRPGKGMTHKLADELADAAEGRGEAAKKREDTHRMAEANKAFAHYRW